MAPATQTDALPIQLSAVRTRRPKWLGRSAIVAATAFIALTILVLARPPWLANPDRTTDARANSAVAAHSPIVSLTKAITTIGDTTVVWIIVGVAVIVALIARRLRLVGFLVTCAVGARVLESLLKRAVDRVRPIVAHPLLHAGGSSYPSGHALRSIVCIGAVAIALAMLLRGVWRALVVTVATLVIVAVGASRVLLGVHYPTDVVGAWLVGLCLLAVAAYVWGIRTQR